MPLSAASTSNRLRLRVRGIVQGVGFRPFVYQLAVRQMLGGYVLNDGEGVLIEVEGPAMALAAFTEVLSANPPPLARVDEVLSESLPPAGDRTFTIRASAPTAARTMVSPDIAVCDACTAELHDPSNRRYRYALINCTDCGPRYSIINALPYDRPNTSMQGFEMCPACEAEYNDPANRRYHAQPISCFSCGPKLLFLDTLNKQNPSDYVDTWSALAAGPHPKGTSFRARADEPRSVTHQNIVEELEDALACCVKAIREGKIVAVKGMGGFHLICDASNEAAVQALRERKRRPTKPLAVMFPTLETIKAVAEVSEAEERLILSKERPIVIVRKKNYLPSAPEEVPLGCSIFHPLSPSIAPGIDRLGVFLPYTPLHILLLEALDCPVVATSANLSDEPIITDASVLREKLGHIVDAILDHERPIVNACDDSVAAAAGEQTVMLRMARGFAPKSLPLTMQTSKKILAVGAHQKNAIALAFGGNIILSPHIGDLNTLDAVEYFDRTIETFKRFYGFEPDIIACDLHPEYESTKWAEKTSSIVHTQSSIIKVQHHYAHALACMAEYGLNEAVLAFCFDGTGYGDDGTLWGGEVLLADPLAYERLYRLRPFRLLGGEKAVREPRRVALSLLFECYTLEEVLIMTNPAVQSFNAEEIKTLHAMWRRGLNAPMSSSVGRLFDAAASLTGTAQTLGYEGESGLLLESAAAGVEAGGEDCFTLKEGIIDWEPMLSVLLSAPSVGEAAAAFHVSLSNAIVGIALRYPGKPVVLSGGVFQNRILAEQVLDRLGRAGIRCYLQRSTPVNDGGIALGQLYHVLHRELACASH